MTKIMLVEDDKSLREIYSIRLVAEGYEVVSAGDGEEALALAVQQKPDLIISDVMMPKISGFDMLDILRSTPETKDIKVIMMTALSSDDQRQRGESLGADKYLVKSQVGIEDVINAVHEVLGDKAVAGPTGGPAPDPTAPTIASQPMGAQPVAEATPVATQPQAEPTPAAETAPAAAEPVATPAAETAPAATEPAPQSSNSAAMDELLNSAPDSNNATWPGNTAQ
ncbi:response regulator [Candidatus Saccharibacteria bacterium]|nr:response regulator [Candidatus Saccharibacteria bacterium]